MGRFAALGLDALPFGKARSASAAPPAKSPACVRSAIFLSRSSDCLRLASNVGRCLVKIPLRRSSLGDRLAATLSSQKQKLVLCCFSPGASDENMGQSARLGLFLGRRGDPMAGG
jgi:hypothetical protein